MTAALVILTIIGLVVYALQRNHVRQARPSYTGSFDHPDRDLERIQAELAATAGRATRPAWPAGHGRHRRLRLA